MSLPQSFKQLIRGRLSPVGEPIRLDKICGGTASFVPQGFGFILVNSGTAALALAMSLAASRADKAAAEVIVPAYGCPDLIAAADFAGLVPVLVDIEKDSPRYQLGRLDAVLNDNTVAIVAVDFLGLGEDLAALRSVIGTRNILLIEDDAQFFPLRTSPECYQGDLIVHSFGRGKPISQIGGGALLVCGELERELAGLANALPVEQIDEGQWRLKARLFNRVLQPRIYQLLTMLPMLHIGETRYHSLEEIQRMEAWRLQYLESNIESYRARSRLAQQQIDEQLQQISGNQLINLPRALNCLKRPLLRYPLLCDSEAQCKELYHRLLSEGLGVSRMYERPLADIDDVPHLFYGEYSGAAQFAHRLITLPVTSFVDSAKIRRMGEVMISVSSNRAR